MDELAIKVQDRFLNLSPEQWSEAAQEQQAWDKQMNLIRLHNALLEKYSPEDVKTILQRMQDKNLL